MTFSDSHIGEARGDRINRSPELGEGEVAARGRVDEGGSAMMGPRGDECRHVQRLVWWE